MMHTVGQSLHLLPQLITKLSAGQKALLCGMPAITAVSVIAFLKSRGFSLLAASMPATLVGGASLALISWCYLRKKASPLIVPESAKPAQPAMYIPKFRPSRSPYGADQALQKDIADCIIAKKALYLDWKKVQTSANANPEKQGTPIPSPHNWCTDRSVPNIQIWKANPVEASFTAICAQAVTEVLPGLFLGGHNQPEVFHSFNQGAISPPEYSCVIRATIMNAFGTGFGQQWQAERGIPQGTPSATSSPIVFQFSGNHPTNPNKDVGLNSFRGNDDYAEFLYAIRLIDETLQRRENVFVMCQQGADRSASVVIGYVMWKYGLSAEDAMFYVRSKRLIADPKETEDPREDYKVFLKEFDAFLNTQGT